MPTTCGCARGPFFVAGAAALALWARTRSPAPRCMQSLMTSTLRHALPCIVHWKSKETPCPNCVTRMRTGASVRRGTALARVALHGCVLGYRTCELQVHALLAVMGGSRPVGSG